MSIETLSFVMIFCEGICIVTVRKDTRTSAGWERRQGLARPRTPSTSEKKYHATFVLSQYPNRAKDIQSYRERKDIEPSTCGNSCTHYCVVERSVVACGALSRRSEVISSSAKAASNECVARLPVGWGEVASIEPQLVHSSGAARSLHLPRQHPAWEAVVYQLKLRPQNLSFVGLLPAICLLNYSARKCRG